MNQRVLSTLLALCMCVPAVPTAYAAQETSPQQEIYTAEASTVSNAAAVPTQAEAYAAMIALQTEYYQGRPWTDASSGTYTWKGGALSPGNVNSGTGCVAFAFRLSDEAFGSLPARMYAAGEFKFEDVRVGDILRVNGDSHTVIVLRVTDSSVELAEGNYNSSINWGRTLTKAEVEAADHFITRYPEGYTDDASANDPFVDENGQTATGTVGGLTWTVTNAGKLTISGSGAIPDYNNVDNLPPWNAYADKIWSVDIENGVTAIGTYAFGSSNALSVTIPGSVKTIGNDAFRASASLTSVTMANGVETIGERAFYGCIKLASITFPASVTKVGAGTFTNCTELVSVVFLAGTETVEMGSNLFMQCWKLSNVVLPQKIDCISEGMFQICNVLPSLIIPQGATSIDNSAFSSCRSLTTLTVPASVTSIGSAALSNCSSLKDIYFSGTESQWNSISKTADVTAALANVTVHYDQPVTNPNPGPDLSPDPGPGTDNPGGSDDNEEPHTHTWDSGVVTAHATCTSSGTRTYTCTVCGETRTEIISALGHNYGAYVVTKEATCTEDGVETSTCSRCGSTHTRTIPATGHSYGAATVTKEPTCTEDGEQDSVCSACGDTIVEILPATGHSYGMATVTKEPTCTEDGENESVCSVCGDKLVGVERATGHNFVKNDGGGYYCSNETTEDGNSTDVISEVLRDAYVGIQEHDSHEISKYDYEDEDSVHHYVSGLIHTTLSAVSKVLDYRINDIAFREPTVEEDGLYIYTVTVWIDSNARAAVTSITTEPLYLTIPKEAPAPPADDDEDFENPSGPGDSDTNEPGTDTPGTDTPGTDTPGTDTPGTDTPGTDEPGTDEPGTDDSGTSTNPGTSSGYAETYYISVPSASGGEVILSTRYAEAGSRVTISVYPDSGYELDALTVTNIRGQALTLRGLGSGRYTFTMPAARVTVDAVFSKIKDTVTTPSSDAADIYDQPFTGLGTPGISGIVLNPSPVPFTDVPASKWYYNSVEYVWKHYLMSGVSDTQFAPDETTTRAMIWTVIARMHNIRTDINPGSMWYERGMLWAVEQGVTDGSNPMDAITREQLAVMLWRDAGSIGGGGSLDGFSDASDVSSYAVSAVQWAVSRGILQGSGGQLNPNGTATRAEVAAMIMRYGSNTFS